MSPWHPQRFRKEALEAGATAEVVESAVAAGKAVIAVHPDLPPIFSLRHLADLVGSPYAFLREVVGREIDPYRSFRIPKSISESVTTNYRLISVPDFHLLRTQRWIASQVLVRGRPHVASGAYAKGSDIKQTASLHCGARWLVKLDIKRFFESISELAAYRALRGFGYQPLISFEMSRICTRQRKSSATGTPRWGIVTGKYESIPAYWTGQLGYLPQGAPTSPMIANLVAKSLDEKISMITDKSDLVYTRYADDLSFSTRSKSFSRADASQLVGKVYRIMGACGFSPNLTKTQIVPPGSRKIVLGLLVDGPNPRLTREFRAKLRMHVHFLEKFGPVAHQRRREFASVRSFRNHIEGLVNYAHHIEPAFAQSVRNRLAKIEWPL